MNRLIRDMLNRYDFQRTGDYENALREILQELALLGLWRSSFFEHAAFYGGTALRVMHELDRFSEDMDFSLLSPNRAFSLTPHLRAIEKELSTWGFTIHTELKEKRPDSAIESAFLKAATLEQLLIIDAPESIRNGIVGSQRLRIKLEIDTDPPADFSTETRYLLLPIPFAVRTYALPSLFAGKMYALLFRKWKNRVKGRDWYDFLWFLGRDIPLDAAHLRSRMIQTGHWPADNPLKEEDIRRLLVDRIREVNFDAARADVRPFLKNPAETDLWSAAFFEQVAAKMKMAQSTP